MIPLFKVYMAADVESYLSPVLHSGYIGEGEKTRQFEKAFGKLIRNDNVVVVNSGTSALTLALKLAGVGQGDQVLSTPMTCLATNMAILSVGAVPVWADVMSDGTMDPESVKEMLGKDKSCQIAAIMCMDWGGRPCMVDEIRKMASDHGIFLIEDSCQSIGSTYKSLPGGNAADITAFSFQAIKHLTTGDGGAISINKDLFRDKEMVERAKMMRWFGLDRTKGADMRCNQDPPVAGYKWQMNDIAASIGLANMIGLEDRITKTKQHADAYNKYFFADVDDKDRKSGYWLYTMHISDVNKFIKYMRDNDVECSRVHDRNDLKSVFRESYRCLPGVDSFDDFHVCIPVGWWLEDRDVERITELVLGYK